MQEKTHFVKNFVGNSSKLYYFLLSGLFIYTKLPTTLLTTHPSSSLSPSSTFSCTLFLTTTAMSRIYSLRLLVLSFCLFLSATVVVGQQWVGLFSQLPNSSVLTTLGSTSNTSEVSIQIPGFFINETLVAGKSYQYPVIPDGHPILAKGSPDLQSISFKLQLPANGDMEVSVISAEYKDYPAFEILPSIGNVANDGKSHSHAKGAVYQTDAFYPGQLIEAQQPFTFRNTRNQVFEVFPFQYNPITHLLRFYYNFTFKIVNIGGIGFNPLSSNDLKVMPIEGMRVPTLNSQFYTTRTNETKSVRGSMLIICPGEFMTAIAPLVKWRNQTGTNTTVIDANQFKDSSEIYNAVRTRYFEDSTFAYLLLVGDSKQVPTNMIEYITKKDTLISASDNYYTYLSGKRGPDIIHNPDIMIGRFSAETAKDVEVQVRRTLEYEINPSADANWLSTVTGIGSVNQAGGNLLTDFGEIRKLIDTLRSKSYTNCNEFYDGSQGKCDADGNPSTSDIVAKINQGTGIVFYAGHGSPNGWLTGAVTKSVVGNLNNSGKYPIIWAASCDNGNFVDNLCFAESWLRACDSKGKPLGAVATLMASSSQTSGPPINAMHKIANLLTYPQKSVSTMGAITLSGLISMNASPGTLSGATTDSWILFGDPALNVRTTRPKKLVVSHKGTITLGYDSYSITCNAADGFACISKDGNILGTASLVDGKATIKLSKPASGDSLTLTITSFSYLPYISEIKISKKPGNIEGPSPLNHSELQPISKTFSWEKGESENPIYYLFSLGTDNPPTNLINSLKTTSTQIGPGFLFKYSVKYYWKVTPVNIYGYTEGKVLDFTTIGEPDEDFEHDFKAQSAWLDGGMGKWEMDSTHFFDGKQAIRSGYIQNSESSSLVYPCDVKYCDFVSFWTRTSSAKGDKLQFSIDSVLMGEWSGELDWSFQVFQVKPGKHQLEWRYTKDESIVTGTDAVWIDDIHLPNHLPASAEVMESSSVCEGLSFETAATAKNQTAVIWQTDGDGVFTDLNLANTSYKPGELDQFYGTAKLQMQVQGFNSCPVIDNTMQLGINPFPVILLPSDTIVSSGYSIVLDASSDGSNLYNWSPSGSSSPSIVIDSIAADRGIKSTEVIVTNSFGCSTAKEILVHFNSSDNADVFNIFPNPSNGNFTLHPEKGSAMISTMILLSMDGKVVWSNTDGFTLLGDKKLAIPALPNGVYLLATTTPNGISANQIYIK